MNPAHPDRPLSARHSALSTALATVLVMMAVGCASIVTPPASFTIYDLELPAAAVPDTAGLPVAVEVRAPSWLSTTAMQYRFDDRLPASREIYAESRWAAHPAEMLQRQWQAALGARGNGWCRLRIDLDEFIQRFDSIEASHAQIVVHASLLTPREARLLAQRRFTLTTSASTADAAGGVLAHRQGVGELAGLLANWLAELDADEAGGLNIRTICRP